MQPPKTSQNHPQLSTTTQNKPKPDTATQNQSQTPKATQNLPTLNTIVDKITHNFSQPPKISCNHLKSAKTAHNHPKPPTTRKNCLKSAKANPPTIQHTLNKK